MLSSETTSSLNGGVVVEIWCKNILRDKTLGHLFVPLDQLPYNNQYEYPISYEQWWSIDR